MKKGLFSVDDRKTVVFSRGNLQYQPSAGQWRFAERQFDFVGEGNASHDGWVDLFEWEQANKFKNPIKGGEDSQQWQLLNQTEWGYLFYERETESGMSFAKAKVHGVNGMVLVPDAWDGSGFEFNNADENGASYDDNVISDTQWDFMEKVGMVFLPAAGYTCEGVYGVGAHGAYWTSSPMGCEGAMHFVFIDKNFFIDELDRFFGCSVRLARMVR